MNYVIDRSEKLKQAIDICFDLETHPKTSNELLEYAIRQDSHTFIKVTVLKYFVESIITLIPELDIKKEQQIPKELIASYYRLKRNSIIRLPMRILRPLVMWCVMINVLISLTFVLRLLLSPEHSVFILSFLDYVGFFPIITLPVILVLFVAQLFNPTVSMYRFESLSLHHLFVEVIKLNRSWIDNPSVEDIKAIVKAVYYNPNTSGTHNSSQIKWCLEFIKKNSGDS